MDQVDLSHYNTEKYLSLHQACALIAGFDPFLSPTVVSDKLRSRYGLASSQLARDYEAEIERFIFGCRTWFSFISDPGSHDVSSLSRHLKVRIGIRSRNLQWQVADALDDLPVFSYDTPLHLDELPYPVYPVDDQTFHRDELVQWCQQRGWSSAYDFDGWTAEDGDSPRLPQQPAAQTWPWGAYDTKLLRLLPLAYEAHWKNYDPSKPETAPKSEIVAAWLESEHKAPNRVAEVIAQLLRADELPSGPRRKTK